MERRLGTQLVFRSAGGHGLTAAGTKLAGIAATVANTVSGVDRELAGRDARLSGHLRITCVDMLAERYLAPHLAGFIAAHPEVEITLLTSLRPLDIMRREADVAIRISENPPGALVGRRLSGFALAAYSAPEYLPSPSGSPDPAEIDWIGWESEAYTKRMITEYFPQARIRHRADSLSVLRAMVREGMGASVFPCYWADADPALRRLFPKVLTRDEYGLWVLAHPDVRRTERVRAFTGHIANALRFDRVLFEGRLTVP